jgi:hypothetical protein
MERQKQARQWWVGSVCRMRGRGWLEAHWSGRNACVQCADGDCTGGDGVMCVLPLPLAGSRVTHLYACVIGKKMECVTKRSDLLFCGHPCSVHISIMWGCARLAVLTVIVAGGEGVKCLCPAPLPLASLHIIRLDAHMRT